MKFSDIGFPNEVMDLDIPGKVPVVVRGPIHRLGSVPTLAEIESALVRQKVRWFRIARNGIIHPEMYIALTMKICGQLVRVVNLPVVTDLLSEGATAIVDRVYEISSPVIQLKREIERVFGVMVGANAYIATKGRGFSPHKDSSDVFALQLQGSKSWKVSKPQAFVDGKIDPFFNEWDNEFVLEEGDAIYVPEGWWHVCDTIGPEGSFHITFSIQKRDPPQIPTMSRRQWRKELRILKTVERMLRSMRHFEDPSFKLEVIDLETVGSWKAFSLM